MKIHFFADIFNTDWQMWQDIMLLIVIIIAAVLFFFLIAFLLLNNSHMEADGRRVAKRIAWYEGQLQKKYKVLEDEEEKIKKELDTKRSQLKEKSVAADEAEVAVKLARQQTQEQVERLKTIYANNELTKKELAEYQKREGTYVPEDVAVNIVTDRVIDMSEFIMNSRYVDCKIPQDLSLEYSAKQVVAYLEKKPDVAFFPATGKRPARYKVNNKSFAFLLIENNFITISFKCGPDYATKLTSVLKDNVEKATFPNGLLWYSVSNEITPCSLELLKLLIDISYKIASLGY